MFKWAYLLVKHRAVKTCYVHARVDHRAHFIDRLTRRSDCADDLGFTVVDRNRLKYIIKVNAVATEILLFEVVDLSHLLIERLLSLVLCL